MSETNFTLGPTSKTNKFPLSFLVIVGQNSQHKRAKSDTFKVVFKGILHQKIFYRLNLIFWIVMGCGIADFDRRGL